MRSEPRLLILETSHQPGLVALAEGARVLGSTCLDQARRHARDLVPAAAELLRAAGWKTRELEGVIVSRGPGSYTGLRVGLMSAKTLAYATEASLLGVETFAAIARQAPAEAGEVAVLADGQQGKAYVQRFARRGAEWQATTELEIRDFDEWHRTCSAEVWLTGPGLEVVGERLPPSVRVTDRSNWVPAAESLLSLGLARIRRGERDDPFALEPIYLRPSSAEEKWAREGKLGGAPS